MANRLINSAEVINELERMFQRFDREFDDKPSYMRNYALGQMSGIRHAIRQVESMVTDPERRWWQWRR